MGSSSSTQSSSTDVGDPGSNMASRLAEKTYKFLSKTGVSDFATEFIKNLYKAGSAVALSELEARAKNDKRAKIFYDSLKQTTAGDELTSKAMVGGCYEAFAMSRASKAGGAELDSALTIGGCGCSGLFVGAADMDLAAVKNYSATANASAKDALVNNIIQSLGSLGLKYDANAVSSQEKLRSLINSLPSSFKSDAASQTKTISGIVGVINKAFGETIIEPSMSPEESAKRILEVLHSLTAGMHSEYLMVYSDIITTIKNLRILTGALEDSLKKIDSRIKDKVERDPGLANLRTAVDLALGESKRQLAMLEGLMNTTLSGSDKLIAKLLEKVSSMENIEKLSHVGDKQFGKTIHDILTGMGVTANLSIVINNALKTVGMTLDQYAKTSSVSQLLEKVEAGAHKLKDDDEAEKFFKAVKTLTTNLWRAGDFSKYASQSGEVSAAYEGAAEYEATPVERQIKNRKNIRDLIFTAFNKKVQEGFARLISTIDVLSVKIGTDVPITTELDAFRSSLSRIDNNLVYHKNIYYALIGYYNDSLSKSKREEFIAELKVVKTQAEIVASKPEFSSSAGLFNEVISSINAITSLIDQYTDEIAAKFGSDEVSDPNTNIDGGCDACDDAAEVLGGDDFEIKPAAVAFKSVHNIHDAVVKFDYRFKVAQIRRNLKATSAELDEYSKDYDKLVTNSIYEIMADEKKKYNTLRAQLDEGRFGRSADYVNAAVNKYSTAVEVDAQKAAALKILDSTWKTKEKFWATVEAVDRYMQVFTDSLVKNPEDVQDIKSMLDSIEIISDWYTDATGNSAAGVFDYFPRKLNNAFADYPDESYHNGPEHYYKRIGNKYSSASAAGNVDQAVPGNPYLVADPASASGAIDQVKKTFEGLSVLKNLISVFVHVGSKFGGEELRTKTFMSPAQMYNNLVEYIQASSFAQGYGLFDAAGTFKDDLPLYFNDFKRIGAEFTNITNPAQATTTIAAGPIVVPAGHIQVGHANVVPAGPGAGGVYAAPANSSEKIEQFRQRWGIWMRSIQPELGLKEGFGFKMEDEYFMLMIKSLAAKIFTVVGMYEVLDRPMEFNGLSPIRMTIGGAEGDSIPKIDETVTPLYLRLTLLAQFYRKIFSFTSAGDEEISGTGYDWKSRDDLPRKDKTVKISMVPDIMGTFAGFIRLMFRKIRGVDPDNFSDDDIKEIINEVNTIYSKLKDKYTSDPIAGIIQEFVAEVNRRYAIVSKEERNAYEAEFGSRYDRLTDRGVFDIDDRDAQMPIDIPLLPGEDEAEVTKLAEFQRRLESSTDPKIVTKLSNYKITPDHQKLVRDFRCAIDKFFDNPEESTSFDGPINNVQRKLKIESRDDQRFKLVASLIRGTDAYTKIDGSKYVMFHETVIGQLNLLSGIHSMLSRFKLIAQLIDIKWLEKEFVTWIGSLPNGGNVANTCNTFISYILIKLVELGLISSNTDKFASEIMFSVLGAGSNMLALGGNGVVGAYIIKKTADIADNIDRDTPIAVGANGVLDTMAGGAAASHLLGVLNGVHKSELNKPEHANKLQTVFRYLFDRKFIMKLLIESLFGITSDLQGLVQISWDRNKLSVNMGGIKKLVLDLFESVGYFVDALRPQLDKQFINEYTNKANAGSLYWLQEQLIEKIIEGRDAHAATGNNPALSKYDSLERVAQNISNTYGELTREWTVNGTRLSSAGNSLVTESPASRDTYDKVLAEIIFYDGSKPESGIASSKFDRVTYVSEEQASVIDYIHDPFEALHFMGPQGSQTIDTRYIHRFKQLYGFDDKFTNNRSALFMFNQLVAKFIKSFYDPSSQKIYSPLLSQFANGIFSRAVSDHTYAYPDTAPAYFLKFVSGENVVLSSEHNFKSIIKPDQIDKVDTLASIVASYLKYKPGGNGPVPRRENRFNLSDPLLSGTYQMQIGVGPAPAPAPAPVLVGVQKLYCLLALFAAAKSIRRVIKGTGNDGTVVPGGVDPGFTNEAAELISIGAQPLPIPAGAAAGAPPPVRNLNATLALYGAAYNVGNKPSTEAIVDYLLSLNGGALGTTIEQLASCDTVLAPEYRKNINESNMTRAIAGNNAVGDATSSQGLLYAYALANQASKAFQYLEVVDRFLTLNGNISPVDKWYSISDIVASKIPYKVPAAAPSTEINFVANIFAGMIIAFASRRSDLAAAHDAAAGAAGGANVDEQNKLVASWDHFKSELFKQNQGSSVYVPPALVQPKTDVKRDDIVGAVTEDFLGAFRAPNMNNDYIILARSEQVPGALKPGNVGALSGAVGKAGIFQDRPGNPGISSDSRLSVTKFGNRMDPDGEHVLFSSIANILKSLYQSRNSTQGTVFLHESIADVALYMKEKFRANLPAFKNLFNELRHKCEFTKKLLEQSELNLTRDFSIMRPTHNPWPYVLKDPVVGNSETKSRFGGILDTIIQGCNTLVAACEQVLREVGDDPKYLEIHNGSIKDYKAQYGNEPFMPITSMLRMLVNSNDASVTDLVPVHGMGEEQFKLMYGIRGLFASLQSDPMSDNLPGFGTIVEQFNTLLDPKLQVSKERCDQFVKVFVKSLRFLYESKHLKGTITPFVSYGPVHTLDGNKKYNRGLFSRRDLVITEKDNSGADRIAAAQSTDPDTNGVDILLTNKAVMSISTLTTARGRKHIKPVFAIAKPLADILRLSESSDRDARVRELVEYIKSDVSGRKNSKEIQNIIDLNIVPINIHALRREIPLVNLYNYAYTFDRMIIELYYGLRSDAARKLIAELCEGNNVNISSAKDMLVSLLINPYRDLRSADTDLWNTHAKGMLVGVASEAELGRPKFLSDQLYNKAVFGEMYISDMDRNEVGPAAAEVMNRKPTKETLLTFASDRARAAVLDLYGRNALGAGVVFDTPEFIKYMDATVKMYIDNPKLTIVAGAAKLSAKAQPVATFGGLPTANDRPSHYKLAYVSCMWAKISVAVGSYIANNVVNSGYNTSMLNNISDVAAWLMIAVSEVTSRQVGAGHPPRPANASEFSAEVMTQLTANINAGGGGHPAGASGVIDINATSVRKHIEGILELFAENVHIVIVLANNDITTGYNAAAQVRLSNKAKSMFTDNYNIPDRIVPSASLHWLDIDKQVEPRDRTQLSGLPDRSESMVHAEDVSQIRDILALFGRARFDTRFIRNLIFIVNLFRSVRVKLQRDLTYSRDIIQRSAAITRNPITEFTGNMVDANQSLASSVAWSKY